MIIKYEKVGKTIMSKWACIFEAGDKIEERAMGTKLFINHGETKEKALRKTLINIGKDIYENSTSNNM